MGQIHTMSYKTTYDIRARGSVNKKKTFKYFNIPFLTLYVTGLHHRQNNSCTIKNVACIFNRFENLGDTIIQI